jgi:hypothetical protein
MPNDCETGILWRSTYRGQEEGHFILDHVDTHTGNFTGKFYEGKDTKHPIDIMGRCDGAVLWFVKPAISPQYHYSGIFVDTPNGIVTVEGDRFPVTIPLLNSFLVAEESTGTFREAGDWVGEKGL